MGNYEYLERGRSVLAITYADCNNKLHALTFSKGHFLGAILGIYRNIPASGPTLEETLDAFFTKGYASHLCGNAPCCKPFRLVKESRFKNLGREDCMKKKGDCKHEPQCLKYIWARKSDWTKVQAECHAEVVPIIKPIRQCTDWKHDKSQLEYRLGFTETLRHWSKGVGCWNMDQNRWYPQLYASCIC